MALDTKTPKSYRKAYDGEHRPSPGWCRDERLRIGRDELIEQRNGFTLVKVTGEFGPENIHAGKWILWGRKGKCETVGSEAWARKKFDILARDVND